MVVCAPPLLQPLLDRELMLSCLALSSSEVGRAAARAWLEAYEAARRAGASQDEAEQRAWEAERAARAPPE
jgi:hypothetical protein